MVGKMIALDIIECIKQLVMKLVNVLVSDFTLTYQLGERVAVYVIGDDAHTHSRDLLEVVYHNDMGVGKVVAHLKLFLYHFLVLFLTLEFRTQGLEHKPFAKFLGCVDVIEFLIPFGEVFDLSPFWCGSVHIGALLDYSCKNSEYLPNSQIADANCTAISIISLFCNQKSCHAIVHSGCDIEA